jgi:hypothetical protein
VAAVVTVGAIDMVAGDGSGEGRWQPRQVVEVAAGEGLGFRIVLYDTISEILFGEPAQRSSGGLSNSLYKGTKATTIQCIYVV